MPRGVITPCSDGHIYFDKTRICLYELSLLSVLVVGTDADDKKQTMALFLIKYSFICVGDFLKETIL